MGSRRLLLPSSSALARAHLVAGLLVLLTPASTLAGLPPQLWNFDPDYYPAPPPAERPPISRHAVYDAQLLPFQILGIAGGYVLSTLFIFTCLLTAGRRWRRSAQSSHGTLSMEMVQPNRWMGTQQSPAAKSVSSFRRWGKSASATSSPVANDPPSFDAAVLQTHRVKQDEEMARIYDVVMQQDTKSPKSLSVKSGDFGTGHVRTLSNSSRSFSQRRPPQLRDAGASPLASPTTPTAPPQYSSYSSNNYPYPQYPQHQQQPLSPTSIKSPMSYEYHSAHSRNPSDGSNRSRITGPPAPTHSSSQDRMRKAKSARSIRNLTISAPIPTNKYPGSPSADDDDDARTPLSPRNYGNIMPPPTPPGGRPITPIQDDPDEDDYDDADTDGDVYEYEQQPRRPLPAAAPHRSYHAAPPPLPPPPPRSDATHALPLRAYAASNASASSSATAIGLPLSPGPTKTTLLSPRRREDDRSAAGFVGMAPLGTARTPGTAGLVPRTPLSPYMPFTPVTPVTPRLATREGRRRRAREQGRRVANVDEDLVVDERDMWGAGW